MTTQDQLTSLEQCLGVDEVQCILARVADGWFAVALVCRRMRDIVHSQLRTTQITSTVNEVSFATIVP